MRLERASNAKRERSLTTAGEAAACSPAWDLRASSVSIQHVTGGGGGNAAEEDEDEGRTVVSLINQGHKLRAGPEEERLISAREKCGTSASS